MVFQPGHSLPFYSKQAAGNSGVGTWQLLERSDDKYSRTQEKVVEYHDCLGRESGAFLLCIFCSNRITRAAEGTLIDGAHIHTYANPHGMVFRFGCFLTAVGCIVQGERSADFSWFVDYVWQIAVCRRCGIHMGWHFHSKDNHFYGLVLERLVEEVVDYEG